MPYCENCGEKLSAGVLFCENCGAKVEPDESVYPTLGKLNLASDNRFTIFQQNDWAARWRKIVQDAGAHEVGIIMTRETALLNELVGSSPEELHRVLDSYCLAAAQRNVDYYYWDIAQSTVAPDPGCQAEDVLNVLKKVVAVGAPKYLFILGDKEVIDAKEWRNETYSDNLFGDQDKNVWGDFVYSSLDASSPFEREQLQSDKLLRTGRLPSLKGETWEAFCSYFTCASEHIGKFEKPYPYALSAQSWLYASTENFNKISKSPVNLCPNCDLDNHGEGWEEGNLLYFNLHGGDLLKFWIGDPEQLYAMSVEEIQKKRHPYFLGVEACYGAQYGEGLSMQNSILLAAMRRGCISFLGSSKIATGNPRPEGRIFDADNMIGAFIEHVHGGDSAGDAYCAGVQKVWEQRTADPASMIDKNWMSAGKTLAEFSLYGDPSARMTWSAEKQCVKSKAFRWFPHIAMPDVHTAVQSALCEVNEKIANAMERELQRWIFREMSPEQIRSRGGEMYCTSGASPLYWRAYRGGEGEGKTAAFFVTCDSRGKVLRIAGTK